MRATVVLGVLIVILISGCHKDPIVGAYNPFFVTYQGAGDLIGRDILLSDDRTTIYVCGYGQGINADEDLALFWLDTAGYYRGRNFAGTSGNDQCWSFVKANDGGFVFAGWTDVNDPGVSNDVLIVKTDMLGNLVWSKTYGGDYNDLATHIATTSDGYIVSAIKGGAADENSWILKLTNNGDTTWTFNYGGNMSDGAMSVCVNKDLSYAITGYTNSSGNGSTDGYLMLLNANGTLRGYYPFGSPDYEEPHDIVQTETGWVITGHSGTTDITTHSVFEQFLNSNGEVLGFYTFGAQAHDGGESMELFHDRIYIVGRSASRDPNQDVIYVETDLNGNEVRKDWIGTPNEDPGYGIYVDAHQVLMTGYAVNPITGNKDLLVLRK